MSKLRVKEIAHSNGTQAMTVDANGYIHTPQRPIWKAKMASTTSANNTVIYDTEEIDTASGYSTSTGKYTIPVDGIYVVTVQLWGASNEADLNFAIRNGTTDIHRFAHQTTVQSGQELNANISMIFDFDAGDEISVYTYAATRGSVNFNQFAGYLIG